MTTEQAKSERAELADLNMNPYQSYGIRAASRPPRDKSESQWLRDLHATKAARDPRNYFGARVWPSNVTCRTLVRS